MAIGAGIAQAENSGGSWTYINSAGELKILPNEQPINYNLDSATSTLLTKIAGVKVEFICTGIAATEAKLLTGGTALGSLKFSGCSTKLNGATSVPCKPNAEGKESGVIKTLKMVLTLLLHKLPNGSLDKIMIAEGDVGSGPLIHVETSEECSIGETVLFGGKVALIDCRLEGEVHLLEHLIKEFEPLTHLWAISDTAEHAAHLDGSWFIHLIGTNAFKEWAALWN